MNVMQRASLQMALYALMLFGLTACGGGGGGGGSSGGGSGGGTTLVTVGGKVSGLTGTGLVLANNGGDSLSIAADGTFTFTKSLASGSSYSVTVTAQPRSPMQLCDVSGGTGQAGTANVVSITVTCTAPAATVNLYPIGATDLAWDSQAGTLYVALGNAAPASPNSVAAVDTSTAALGTSVNLTMSPSVLRVSDDGALLYVGSNSNGNIRRFRLPNLASDITIPLGSSNIGGPGSPAATRTLEIEPGAAHTIAVSRFDPATFPSSELVLFDDATVRGPPSTSGPPVTPDQLAWNTDGTSVFAADPLGTSPPSIGTFAVTANGIAYQSEFSGVSAGGSGLEYLQGDLYLSSGIVVDPATQNAVGTLLASGPTVVDADNGVIFVAQNDMLQGTTLWAFDRVHFTPIGKLRIDVLPNVFPRIAVQRVLRFGIDGIAMLSSAGDLIVVQHALTLPDPALGGSGALLSSTAGSTSYSVYDLPAQGLVWSTAQNLLYVSLHSDVSGRGNSIAAFDPATGMVGVSTFVGSEPSHLALGSDGKTLYAALTGASEVAQVSIPALMPGPTLLLGADSFLGANYPSVVEVAPGSATTLAVVQLVNNGANSSIAVYDGITKRPSIADGDFRPGMQWGSDATTLYELGYSSGPLVSTYAVDAGGVSQTSKGIRAIVNTNSSQRGMHFASGLLYADEGTVFDPASTSVKASITGGTNSVMTVDTVSGIGFFLSSNPVSTGLMLAAVDLAHGNVVSRLVLPDVSGLPMQITRWGSDGLAFATTAGQLVIVRGSLVTKPAPANPCGTAAGTALTSMGAQAADFSTLLVTAAASDIVYEPHSGLLYASIAADSSLNLNCIVPLVPATGTVGAGVFAGSRPGPLAVSDNGAFLYTALAGADSIERLALPALTHNLSIPVAPPLLAGSQPIAADIDVAPGAPGTIAAVLQFTFQDPASVALTIYDNATPRNSIFTSVSTGAVQWGASASTVYGYDNQAGSFDLYTLPVSSSGVGTPSGSTSALQQFGGHIHRFGSLIYGDNGQVVDPLSGALAGTFVFSAAFTPVPKAAMTADTGIGAAYFAYSDVGAGQMTVQAFSLADYTSLRTIALGALAGTPIRMVRWGTNGLAILLDSGTILLVSGSFVTG